MSNDTPVAFVTGASRGIGKAGAIALAEAGFDVVITARTEREGEGRTEANSVRNDDPIVQIVGSLESTAKEIEARGRRALPIKLDLLDTQAIVDVPAQALAEWGRIDVLFNNAVYAGGATMDRIMDLTPERMLQLMAGNYANQVLLIQQVIPHMLERESGKIINMVSGSARQDPIAPAGLGGWGIGYSASKAAFARVAGGIEAEFSKFGIRAFNVDPGNVITEKRKALRPDDAFSGNYGSEPAEATGAVVAWLATSPDATSMVGKWIYAPKLCADRGLLPGWPEADPATAG
ncbi:MAG: oxidoreductase [Ilumatobacteraceae bacterium]|nr:oxidoreductase [Ilumatobacteraceae bacterium]